MGSFGKHVRGAIALILAFCLAFSMTPAAAFAVPAMVPAAASASPSQDAQAAVDSDVLSSIEKQELDLSAGESAQTSIAVSTYSDEIHAKLLAYNENPYKVSELVKAADTGSPITFKVEAFGGGGVDKLSFAWNCNGNGVSLSGGEMAKYVMATEIDPGSGHAISAVNVSAMAKDGIFADGATYDFSCTVSSEPASGSSYEFEDVVCGTAKLVTVSGSSYPYETIYADGSQATYATQEEPDVVYNIDANRASSVATASGAIHYSAKLIQSEIPKSDGAYVSFTDALPNGSVMGQPFAIDIASDSAAGAAFTGQGVKVTLPVSSLPDAANKSNILGVLTMGTTGVPTLVGATLSSDGKYVLFETSEMGAFAIVAAAHANAQAYSVAASVGEGEGTIEPAPTTSAHQYVLGCASTYKLYADSSAGYGIGRIVVTVDSSVVFTYENGNTACTVNGVPFSMNPADRGITFGGNFVTFDPASSYEYDLQVNFKKLDNGGGSVENASVSASVVGSKGGKIAVIDSANAGNNVTWPPVGQTLVAGDNVVVYMIPDDGWGVKSVTVNGQPWSFDGKVVSFTANAGNNVVEVEFQEGASTPPTRQFKIVSGVDDASKGEVVGDGEQAVNKADTAQVTFKAKSGNHIEYIEDILVDDSGVAVAGATPKITQVGTDDDPVSNFTYELANVVANHKVVAHFATTHALQTVNVSVLMGKGTVVANGAQVSIGATGKGSFTLRDGESATMHFYADPGYKIGSVAVDNNAVTLAGGACNIVGNSAATRTVSVVFVEDSSSPDPGTDVVYYNVALNSGVGGSIVPNISSLPAGASETFYFNASAGYVLNTVTVNGVNVTSSVRAAGNSYYLENVKADVAISATWMASSEAPADETVNISIDVQGAGYAVPASAQIRKGGDTAVYLYAEQGCTLKGISLASGSLSAQLSPQQIAKGVWKVLLVGVSEDVILNAEFKDDPSSSEEPTEYFTVNASAGEGGAILPSGAVRVKSGADAEFTVSPDAGYRIKSVRIDGSEVSDISGNTYVIASIKENGHTIEATFATDGTGAPSIPGDDLVVVTTSASAGGTISPDNPTVLAGSDKTFNFSASTGYELSDVLVDTGSGLQSVGANMLLTIKEQGFYKLENIQDGYAIQAQFAPVGQATKYFSITVSPQPKNGSIVFKNAFGSVISDLSHVMEGTSVVVQPKPNSGYELSSLVVNGTPVTGSLSSDGTYTFEIHGNTTVSAEFVAQVIPPDPTVTTLQPRNISTFTGKEVTVSTDVEGAVVWQVSKDGSAFAPVDGVAVGANSFKKTFSDAGTYTYRAYVEDESGNVVEQIITVVVQTASAGGGNGTITVEPEVPLPPVPGIGEGGDGGKVEVGPPTLPGYVGEQDVVKTEWFVSTDDGATYVKISSSAGFNHEKYAAENLPDGEYVFKCEVTYNQGDVIEYIYKVKVGDGDDAKNDPTAGIPDGEPTDPSAPLPGGEINVADKNGSIIKPSIGNSDDEYDWYVKNETTGEWVHLPSSSFPGMTPNDDGTLSLSPEVDPDDYEFKVVVKDKETGVSSKEEIDVTVVNKTPGAEDGVFVGQSMSISIPANEGALLVPSVPATSASNDWYVSVDGGTTWTKLPAQGEFAGINADADGNLAIPSSALTGGSEYAFRVVANKDGKAASRQDFFVTKGTQVVPDDGTGSGGSTVVPGEDINGGPTGDDIVIGPSKGTAVQWFIKIGDEWQEITTDEGQSLVSGEATLDLAPGDYVVRVITEDESGNKYKQDFNVHIPFVDSNTSTNNRPNGVIDVTVSVSVEVTSATITENGNVQTSISGTPNGMVSPSGMFKATMGDNQRFFIFPNKGYTVEYVDVAGKHFDIQPYDPNTSILGRIADFFGLGNPKYYECYTVDVPIDNNTVKDGEMHVFVKFTKIEGEEGIDYDMVGAGDTYNVAASADSGVIYPKESMKLPAGANVKFMAFPVVEGAPLKSMTVSGESVVPAAQENGTYTYELTVGPDAADASNSIDVRAIFASGIKHLVNVSVTPAEAGTISPERIEVEDGGTQVFEIRANAGYELSHVLVNGNAAAADNAGDGVWTYTLSGVSGTTDVVAVFKAVSQEQGVYHKIQAFVEGGNGSVSPAYAEVKDGGQQTFTFTPDRGYAVASVSVDGASDADATKFANATSYSFANVTCDHTLVVKFTPVQLGGSPVQKTIRTLTSLAKTGDGKMVLTFGLVAVASAALGVAVLVYNRSRRRSESGVHARR